MRVDRLIHDCECPEAGKGFQYERRLWHPTPVVKSHDPWKSRGFRRYAMERAVKHVFTHKGQQYGIIHRADRFPQILDQDFDAWPPLDLDEEE